MNCTKAVKKRKNKRTRLIAFMLLAAAFVGASPTLFAQSKAQSIGLKVQPDSLLPYDVSFAPVVLALPATKSSPEKGLGPVALPEMPRAYSYNGLGLFCKWEVQLEKAARLPVKFRLGEVQYVERMEGKLPGY
ncbi:MAG: hypothetical protein H6564_04390 [Lewinellaceae bacterium]|nr:hypothetical protein [Lewinellaceae bacterium]